MDARLVNEDPISPAMIEHRCEEIACGGELEQSYNYIVYHFECDGVYFWARAYLDDVKTVSLYGPFESRTSMKLTDGAFDDAVLVYLKRRFRIVRALRNGGYASI